MGSMGCTCGALTGGIIVIGLLYGRNKAGSPEVSRAIELTARLYQTFCQKYKISCCKVLTKNMEKGSPEHRAQCISLTGEMAYQTARLILEEEQK